MNTAFIYNIILKAQRHKNTRQDHPHTDLQSKKKMLKLLTMTANYSIQAEVKDLKKVVKDLKKIRQKYQSVTVLRGFTCSCYFVVFVSFKTLQYSLHHCQIT